MKLNFCLLVNQKKHKHCTSNMLVKILLFIQVSFGTLAQINRNETIEKEISFNLNQFNNLIKSAPKYQEVDGRNVQALLITLPDLIKESEIYEIVEIKDEALFNKERPDLKFYRGLAVGDKTKSIRITVKDFFFTATIIENGELITFQKKNQNRSDQQFVLKNEPLDISGLECGFIENDINKNRRSKSIQTADISFGDNHLSYRFAILVSDEFYQATKGISDFDANVEAAALTNLNSLNAFYENELSITFVPVSPIGSSNLFSHYTTAITYRGAGYQDLGNVNVNINANFGISNYDIGHMFYKMPNGYGGSGRASLGVVCDNSKGSGWTGAGNSVGSSFVSILLHEVGHQFDASHSFNGSGLNCNGGNYMQNGAVEPGSGTTIMSYHGNCDNLHNLTGPDDNFFHINSLIQITSYITSSIPSCASVTSLSNSIPVPDAGANYSIPKSTPFVLTATGTDADTDVLSYTWEQVDVAISNDHGALGQTNGDGAYNAVNSNTAPLFRSRQSSSPIRTFPDISYVLNNANNPPDNWGEDLPAVARTLNFRITVRDNKSGGGAFASDITQISVINTPTAFMVTFPNTNTLLTPGSTITTTWNVAQSNLAPINVANVKISFSTDGGNTYSTLLASTPNDGSQSILLPNTSTTQGRLKIEAISNIFFDISDDNLTLGICMPEVSSIINNSDLVLPEGDSQLDLELYSRGALISSINGTVDIGDPITFLTVDDGTNTSSCAFYSNSPHYELREFVLSNSANTTIQFSGSNTLSFKLMNLYQDTYTNENVCQNWLASTAIDSPGPINLMTNLSKYLTIGTKYLLKISGFDGNNTGNYNVTSSSAMYKPVPSTGSAYSLTYLIINTNSNLITQITQNTNLTSYSPGNYRIYGLSYATGTNIDTYLNTNFAAFQSLLSNSTICGSLSSNFKNITINSSSPCQSVLTLVNPANNISSGTEVFQASNNIQASNKITGGNVTYDAKLHIQLNEGFEVTSAGGTVFKTELVGCN